MELAILVPLDGSSFSEQALPAAQAMARRLHTGLALVKVSVPASIQLPDAGWSTVEVIAQTDAMLKTQAQNYLETVAQPLAADRATPVTTAVTTGLVLEGIMQEIERTRPELVVMTTHGRGPFSRFWLGSVADQLIRHATVPLLLIRPQQPQQQDVSQPFDPLAGHVLIALDGSPRSEQILAPVVAYVAAGQTRLTLLRVVEPPFHQVPPGAPQTPLWPQVDRAFARKKAGEYLDEIAARLRSKGFQVGTETVTEESPGAMILEEAARLRCTAIALATHARTGLPRMLIGSVADKVVRGSPVPVLLCHGKSSATAVL